MPKPNSEYEPKQPGAHRLDDQELEMRKRGTTSRWHGPGRTPAALLGVALVAVAGCDFDATDPTAITDEDLDTDASMTALKIGAFRTYDDAYDRQIMFTGLIADELTAAGSWAPWHAADNGEIQEGATESDHINIQWRMWRELARARVAGEESAEYMEQVLESPESDPRYAAVTLIAGMSYADFGEVFCEAAYDEGEAVPPEESFALAEERLDEARDVATAAGVDSIGHMADLVQARIHMEQGDMDAALSYASGVPDDFIWEANFRDASGERSYFWDNNADRGESSVHPELRALDDPRVPTEDLDRMGPDTETEVWAQQKYPSRASNFTVASWREARLIEAEVHLERGDVDEAFDLVNQVRDHWDLEHLDADAFETEAEAWEVFQEERRYSLWLEGRRMIDMRRWDLFPDGWEAECLPISEEERRANPNLD